MFKRISEYATAEREHRAKLLNNRMRFGVDFLDDALRGILTEDLVLLGAIPGSGKTELCCNIALANLEDGKKVHFISLESSEYEITSRMKYPLVSQRYHADPNRPKLESPLNFPDWLQGKYLTELKEYEDSANEYFKAAYQNLHLFEKGNKFGIDELIQSILYCAEDTDLIIVDHIHYFDMDENENENRALKKIMKTARELCLEQGRPIVLVGHLRKPDRSNDDMVPDMNEFHGSSDLSKIATKVITMAPGKYTSAGTYETFFRTPKCRIDGGVSRFIGREFYNPKKGAYEKNRYEIGWAQQKRGEDFEVIEPLFTPTWARGPVPYQQGSATSNTPNSVKNLAPNAGGTEMFPGLRKGDKRNPF